MRERRQLSDAVASIEKVREKRRKRFHLRDERINLSHGAGGKASRNLIDGLFAPAFSNALLDHMDDSAVFPIEGRIAFTTDSYVVSPIFFPGGDIGSLAVHGTVNDLAMAGAKPLHMSVAMILEEGFPISDLRRIVGSIQAAAKAAGVRIVTGDTKVVERGKADGLYVNTTGIGIVRADARISGSYARPGDRVLVSGRLAEHGIAIMTARDGFDFELEVESDSAALDGVVSGLLDAVGTDLHCLRDATRGGVATALNEIALASDVAIAIEESALPVRAEIRGACELLGIEPVHMANEGKFVAIVAPRRAEAALAALQAHPLGRAAAIVGEVKESPAGIVSVRTAIGGQRVLDMLVGEALPRIC